MDTKYDNYVVQFAADSYNSLTNSKSRPSTPDILVRGMPRRLNGHDFNLEFGAVCVVELHSKKRKALAKANGTYQKNISHSEIGVLWVF